MERSRSEYEQSTVPGFASSRDFFRSHFLHTFLTVGTVSHLTVAQNPLASCYLWLATFDRHLTSMYIFSSARMVTLWLMALSSFFSVM
jgi:hypothetical protein